MLEAEEPPLCFQTGVRCCKLNLGRKNKEGDKAPSSGRPEKKTTALPANRTTSPGGTGGGGSREKAGRWAVKIKNWG
ncbi:hypothetical protein AKJ51_01630 [candidate division MSBL1 archaeon SCGC-AAA382A20]|uniref:Uncharacterized protein n=1 Tax=candidate division MSBL1 archaeon SCGC-AAA382A20 TaxID=1698280 RepID=A0A133VLE3_9EURY|nr:hypothetical protein AKJ51_01630 [candidate division MSBL1 archaeon SCGC-AAA382A20]